MKLEKPPPEKHLVLYTYVRIIEEYNSKWLNEAKKLSSQQEKKILKQKLQNSDNFQNILW